jgi:hypothetical protein
VLCHATGWLLDRDPEAARKLYQRYVRQGPYVEWAAAFGRECADPDFPAAARHWHADRFAQFRHAARRALPWLAAGAAIVVVGVFGLVARRRRSA